MLTACVRELCALCALNALLGLLLSGEKQRQTLAMLSGLLCIEKILAWVLSVAG